MNSVVVAELSSMGADLEVYEGVERLKKSFAEGPIQCLDRWVVQPTTNEAYLYATQ